jgi:hypothetical protein
MSNKTLPHQEHAAIYRFMLEASIQDQEFLDAIRTEEEHPGALLKGERVDSGSRLAEVRASTPEMIEADKCSAAYHEAFHAFVADTFGFDVAKVCLFRNPNGGPFERHWLGNITAPGILNFESIPAPKGMSAEKWSQFLSRQSFIQRMIRLAGAVGESMMKARESDQPLLLNEVVERLEDNWECLSSSDRSACPGGPESLDFEEIHSLMQLLEWGWDIVTLIAEALMKREHLCHELDELPSAHVLIPSERPWTDFAGWSLDRFEGIPPTIPDFRGE